MTMGTSPATEGRGLWQARPSPTTSTIQFAVPKSPEEADRLLSHAERLLSNGGMTDEYVSHLTRFLGANGSAWTNANRTRLRKVLVGVGEAVIASVVATMNRLPRTDILDDGELVLRSLPREAAPNLRRFYDLEQGGTPGVRTAILRAFARLDKSTSLNAVHTALNAPEAEVRDAAASLLIEIGTAESRELLAKRLERESDAAVRESIREAIGSLQA